MFCEGRRMMDRASFLKTIRTLKPRLCERYKVREIGIFGSVVRGEEGEGSDIDVLVEFEQGADLFDLVGLSLFL
jgi:predicted nucleotidyltransferase